MVKIFITTKKEVKPLSICIRNRETLVSTYHLIEMIALKYFEARKNQDHSKVDQNDDALSHLLKCPKCKEWFYEVTPPKIVERQKRLIQYCCSGIFCSVEEYKERKHPKIEFSLFRGEDPCWMIEGKQTFISFCPWCGQKLPEKPF